MKKQLSKVLILAVITFFLQEHLIMYFCQISAEDFVESERFRAHPMGEEQLEILKELPPQNRGTVAGNYLLDSGLTISNFSDYLCYCDAIWKDVTYFPIPLSTTHKNYRVTYEDSWMSERTYGGRRGHEGVDLMASKDTPGLYPVLSMTDGIITQKGWLEKGGWRIGVQSPSGGYFYYAHLHSYNEELEVGDQIRAGQLLGFMGNSGYGPEGTTGMFATHLHVGIYLYPYGEEISINPYWILRMAEEKKLSCSF